MLIITVGQHSQASDTFPIWHASRVRGPPAWPVNERENAPRVAAGKDWPYGPRPAKNCTELTVTTSASQQSGDSCTVKRQRSPARLLCRQLERMLAERVNAIAKHGKANYYCYQMLLMKSLSSGSPCLLQLRPSLLTGLKVSSSGRTAGRASKRRRQRR